MSANKPSGRFKGSSPSDELIELAPPKDSGFSGTAKFDPANGPMIAELIKRGYTRVEPKDVEA